MHVTCPLQVDGDNWFSTGDVASIDPLGHMAITDRSKDVVKSGGEWVSSIGELLWLGWASINFILF